MPGHEFLVVLLIKKNVVRHLQFDLSAEKPAGGRGRNRRIEPYQIPDIVFFVQFVGFIFLFRRLNF